MVWAATASGNNGRSAKSARRCRLVFMVWEIYDFRFRKMSASRKGRVGAEGGSETLPYFRS